MNVDVIVLGAGAAGMMAAIEAANLGRRVLIVDHAKAPGEKIRISGGGRCNFTNLGIAADRFLSLNPRFALSALKRFSQFDFIARVDQAGIAWHEKTLGQLFCDGSATQIVNMLTSAMARAGVQLWTGCALGAITKVGAVFHIETTNGPVTAQSVIVATGGKSIPKMGASSYGYQVAASFGLPIIETRPALVPLTFAEQDLAHLTPLSGVSVQGCVSVGKVGFDEAVLFTHRGLSGPAVLQISSYWREGTAISLDLAQGRDTEAILRAAKAENGRVALRTALGRILPERLARYVESDLAISLPLAEIPSKTLAQVANRVHHWQMMPVGSEGYRTAEVTLGGVDTEVLDAKTMQVKTVPGLFFIGEVVDVTGWLGGYNFQWAWSSGWAAGQAA